MSPDLATLQAEARAEAERLRADETPSSAAIASAWEVIDEYLPACTWEEHERRKPIVLAIARRIDVAQIEVLTNVADWTGGADDER